MGTCIICGTSVDGRICDIHQEDVVFEFRGDSPDQLTPGRFYRGSVDGFAEFGVFVDIGDSVTGLLHRSELDRQLDSLDWDPGDTVFVKVKGVRDNGNVDLGWSIRQSEREFRGTLIDDPERGHSILKDEEEAESESGDATATESDDGSEAVESTDGSAAAESTDGSAAAESTDGADTQSRTDEAPGAQAGRNADDAAADATADAGRSGGDGGAATASASGGQAVVESPDRIAIGDLADHVGEVVRLEGVVDDVHQTSGPTVFTVRDETGSIECAAFEEAGVRAYPAVEEGDVTRFEGEVRERRGDLQLETEALVVLENGDRTAVLERLDDALEAEARPEAVDPIAEDAAVEALSGDLIEAATAIRRAVIEERPVVVRHAATADGYVAGVALERATLPLVQDYHAETDAVYHYFDRRPLEEGVYDMADATNDVTSMLDNRERHGEKLPLFVFAGVGGTRDSLDGFELLNVYGADSVVVDDFAVEEAVADTVATTVTPAVEDVRTTTATVLAANVAVHVDADVRDDLLHLPAVSYWDDAPEAYVEAAATAGYDETATREIREAVALTAYYHSYEDKRELVVDLVFDDEQSGDGPGGLAEHVSEQFRSKVDAAVETAEANIEYRTVDGVDVAVLDTDAFTHRYEFPPTDLLLDELFRRHRGDAAGTDASESSDAASGNVAAVVGADESELHVRTPEPLDLHAVVDEVRERVPEGGLTAASAHEGIIEYLAGERNAVLDATLDAVAKRI
ncbi:MAG: OB-fold nucleic acid binding domain-containing protein [Haloarculaceae archaeon]